MKNKLFFFFLLILLTPIVNASFNCNLTNNQTYCNKISSLNINESEKDLIYSNLLYTNNNYPNYTFIEKYNTEIKITIPPENTKIYNSEQIKNAWISFLTIYPSVYENKTLYVPNNIKTLSEYNYNIIIPEDYQENYPNINNGDCKRIYTLTQNYSKVSYYLNNNWKADGKYSNITITSDAKIKAELSINSQLKIDHYKWYNYCCNEWNGYCIEYCHKCKYSNTEYQQDSLKISEEKQVILYTKNPKANITVLDYYLNTTKGTYSVTDYSYFRLNFNNSYLVRQNVYYDLVFDKKPYYLATFNAHNFSYNSQKNLYIDNYYFFVKNTNNCDIYAYNYFYTLNLSCNLLKTQANNNQLSIQNNDSDFSLLFYIIFLLLILYFIYKLIKSQFKKMVIPILFLIVFLPFVFADSQQAPAECGLTNLAECIPQKIYEFLLFIINAPLLPMLAFIQILLTATVSIDLFYHVWDIVRYILGFFYLFLFIYAGYIFLTSNANPIRRSQAKDMLKDTIIMIVLIQGSFYIYGLVLSISSILNSSIIGLVDPHFFLLTTDNIMNIGLELFLSFFYAGTLFLTMLMLVVRYIMVSFGVIIFPIGIFCYFIPPLRGYGRFILNVLGVFIFITFIDLLIILACSMIVNIPLFENFKIVVMIVAFSMINYSLWFAIKFSMKYSGASSIKDNVEQAAKYIALVA